MNPTRYSQPEQLKAGKWVRLGDPGLQKQPFFGKAQMAWRGLQNEHVILGCVSFNHVNPYCSFEHVAFSDSHLAGFKNTPGLVQAGKAVHFTFCTEDITDINLWENLYSALGSERSHYLWVGCLLMTADAMEWLCHSISALARRKT